MLTLNIQRQAPVDSTGRTEVEVAGSEMRKSSRLLLSALVFSFLCCDVRGAIYYIDSESGIGSNDGSSPERAIKSLDMINAKTFAPGDRLLFKAGSKFSGQL